MKRLQFILKFEYNLSYLTPIFIHIYYQTDRSEVMREREDERETRAGGDRQIMERGSMPLITRNEIASSTTDK